MLKIMAIVFICSSLRACICIYTCLASSGRVISEQLIGAGMKGSDRHLT
jgi:hypothetical protein